MTPPPLDASQFHLLHIIAGRIITRDPIPRTPFTTYTDKIIELRDICLALEEPGILGDAAIKMLGHMFIEWSMLQLSPADLELIVRIVTDEQIMLSFDDAEDGDELVQRLIELVQDNPEEPPEEPIAIDIHDSYNQTEAEADAEWEAKFESEFEHHVKNHGFPP